MDTVRIGLVGCGGMGRVHYANLLEIPDAKVVALCGASDNEFKAAREWSLPRYDSISDMLDQCQVDVVDICTPTFLHHDMAMECLGRGKHVIVEKPLALSLADAAEMLDEAERRGCQLYVAQVLQFTREVAVLRETVQSGVYGKPLDAYFERLSACPKWAMGGWLFDKERSGLLPYDLHIHDLDVIVSVFGKPESYTFTSCRGEGRDYPEQFRIIYRYPGLSVGAEAAWFNADIPWTARWRVYFENGMLINDGSSLTGYQFGQPPQVFDTADEVMISTGINVPPCGWYYNELKHFVACIRENRPTPYVTREQLLTVMGLLEEIGEGAARP